MPHNWYRKNHHNSIAQYESRYYSQIYASVFYSHFAALEQIKAKGYADNYIDKNGAAGKLIHLIGVEFSSEQRQIVAFEVETVT